MAVSATVRVLRFDPSVDTEPYYKDYEITGYDNISSGPLTVLKALRWINRHIEDVAFDYNCRKGFCGICGMMVNGRACLACETPVPADSTVTVEPLAGFPVVRDLVVDTKKAYDQILKSQVQMKTSSPDKVLQPVENAGEWYAELMPHVMCRQCYSCYAACPVLQNGNMWGSYAGPAAMQQVYARHIDGIDESDRIVQAVELGLFNCMQCGMCTSVCPAHIDTCGNNKKMMAEAEERGLKPEGERNSYWPMV